MVDVRNHVRHLLLEVDCSIFGYRNRMLVCVLIVCQWQGNHKGLAAEPYQRQLDAG